MCCLLSHVLKYEILQCGWIPWNVKKENVETRNEGWPFKSIAL